MSDDERAPGASLEHEAVEIPAGAQEVSGLLTGPTGGPLLVLAHGAGAGMEHAFMADVAVGLARHGIRVLRFNFLYSEKGRRAPDRGPILEATFQSVLAWARRLAGGGPSCRREVHGRPDRVASRCRGR